MPLRRVALCFAAFVLLCAVFSGQSSAQFVVMRAPTQSYVTQALYTHRSTAHKLDENLSFSYIPDTIDTIDVSNGDGPFDYLGTIRNLKSQDQSISFVRVQSLPCGWSTSVCFGGNCFSADMSSAPYLFPADSALAMIVHVYPSVDTVPHDLTMYITLRSDSNPTDSVLIPIHLTYAPPPDVRRFAWTNATFSKTFNGPKKHSVSAQLANKNCDSVRYRFTVQAQVPSSWTWKYCIADAYTLSDVCDTTATMDYGFAGIGDAYAEDIHKFTLSATPPDAFTTDSAVFNVHVQALQQFHGITSLSPHARDTGTYRFSIIAVAPANSVSADPTLRAGIVVLNAWPNPIKANAHLNLELMTDKHGSAEAHIYDMAGIEKASFDLGDLVLGTNRLVVSDLRLPSGEYIMRLEQDGALSGPVRLNIVH